MVYHSIRTDRIKMQISHRFYCTKKTDEGMFFSFVSSCNAVSFFPCFSALSNTHSIFVLWLWGSLIENTVIWFNDASRKYRTATTCACQSANHIYARLPRKTLEYHDPVVSMSRFGTRLKIELRNNMISKMDGEEAERPREAETEAIIALYRPQEATSTSLSFVMPTNGNESAKLLKRITVRLSMIRSDRFSVCG